MKKPRTCGCGASVSRTLSTFNRLGTPHCPYCEADL